MGLTNKIEKAAYELIAPEINELLNDAEELDEKISVDSVLQSSIDKLEIKISESRTGEERYVLDQQLEELININKIYQETNHDNITNFAKKEIISLLQGLDSEINLKSNTLNSYYKQLNTIIYSQEEQLKDTIDLYGNTIRDLVENSIDIKGVRESIFREKYQLFFDKVTIIYINYLEENIGKQLTDSELKILTKNKGLYLDSNFTTHFTEYLIKNLDEKYLELDMDIKFKKGLFEETINIDLKKENKKYLKKLELEKKKLEEQKNNKTISKEKKEVNPTILRMKKIEKVLNSPEMIPFLEAVIYKMKGKVIYLSKNKNQKLDEKFLNKNKSEILNNLKSLVLAIIHIESDGKIRVKNPNSSASGLGQWLTSDGKYKTEYYYAPNWKARKINGKEPSKERTIRGTNSLETRLRNIKNSYSKDITNELDFIPKSFSKKTDIHPNNLSTQEQIKLLLLDLGSNDKKVKNRVGVSVGIKDYLGTAILGNKWAVKEIYKIFHHTQPDKKTSDRISKIFPIYMNKLINLT